MGDLGAFLHNAQHDHDFLTYGGAATDAVYLSLAQTAPSSAYSGLFLYTPLHGKPGCGPAGVYRLQPRSRAWQLDTTRNGFDRTGWGCPPQVRQGVAFFVSRTFPLTLGRTAHTVRPFFYTTYSIA